MGNHEPSLNRKIAQLALPMSLEGFLSASADFIDTLMVSGLGETAVSAVGLGTQFFFIQAMTIYGFSGGASTYMAQFWGSGNIRGMKKTLGTNICCTLFISVILLFFMILIPDKLMRIFTNIDEISDQGALYMLYRCPSLITYSVLLPIIMALKSMQKVRLPVMASISAILLNIFLNYTLIFGAFGAPEMGIAGAALATTLSQFFELIVLGFAMIIQKSELCNDIRDYFSLNKSISKAVIRNSITTTTNELLWSGGMSAYNAGYGRISVIASAAAQAADIVVHIFTKTIYCVGDASLILVGEALGKNQCSAAVFLAKKLLRVNVLLGIIAGAILICISRPIAGLFAFSEESSSYVQVLLCIYGVFMPLKVYNISLITGILRAGGDVKFAMITEVSAIWLVSVPLVLISALLLNFPIYIVVLFAQAEDLVKAILLTRRFRSEVWARNRVEEINC